MFTEKIYHMDGETEKRFIGLLKEKLTSPQRISDTAKVISPAKVSSTAREAPKLDMPDLKLEKQSLAHKLRELEREHQTGIERGLRKIQELNEKREKLKKALDILSELSLNIAEEYAQKLNSYPGEIEKQGAEIERERLYLNYLQTKVLPLIQ